jgi:hypothetical protein
MRQQQAKSWEPAPPANAAPRIVELTEVRVRVSQIG